MTTLIVLRVSHSRLDGSRRESNPVGIYPVKCDALYIPRGSGSLASDSDALPHQPEIINQESCPV